MLYLQFIANMGMCGWINMVQTQHIVLHSTTMLDNAKMFMVKCRDRRDLNLTRTEPAVRYDE